MLRKRIEILMVLLLSMTSLNLRAMLSEETGETKTPSNLEEAFVAFENLLDEKELGEFKNGTEDEVIHYHFGLGMWMRNNWGLWGESDLQAYFLEMDIFHPDDMSGIILDSFWRKLNNQPIRLEEQVAYYQDYWKHNGKPSELKCANHQVALFLSESVTLSEEPGNRRVLHYSECEVGEEPWIYEVKKGLYQPDEETLAHFAPDVVNCPDHQVPMESGPWLTFGKEGKRRTVQSVICPEDEKIWANEVNRGIYKPDPYTLSIIQ